MKNQGHKIKVTFSLASLALLAGCSGSGGSQATSANSGPTAASLAASFDKATTLCQPMSGSGSGYTSIFSNFTSGLQGRLYAMAPQNDGKYTSARDYQTYGIDTGTDVFLGNLDIPTRLFTEGFPAADGHLLSYNEQTLLEYFGLHMESEIQLSSSDAPGQYQLALLSDDGAILSIKAPGNDAFVDFIGDDGLHPTTMACAMTPLTIDTYDTIPMMLDYYQGPRYEIALQLIWRPWPANGNALDPLCGTSGNYQFFNPTTVPSSPEQNYLDLESRGWKPLTPSNFVIPNGGGNPCAVPGYNTTT